MLVHKSTPVAYQDNRVNLGLIFNIAFFFFFFFFQRVSDAELCM